MTPPDVAAGPAHPRPLSQMLDELRTLVHLESPSAAPTGGTECADFLAELGEHHLGLAPEIRDVDGVRHVLWRGPGTPRVLVLGHYDTVWPLGTVTERPFQVEGDIARGPGTFDMKAGLVQALHGLGRVGMDGVLLLLNGDEEVGSPTSCSLIEQLAREVDAALIAESSAPGGALKIGRKGTVQVRMALRGRAAHAGLEPHAGVSTTLALGSVIEAAAALADEGAGTTVTPTTVSSGTVANAVPDSATIDIDVRARTSAELDRVLRGLHAIPPGELLALEPVVRYRREPLEESASAELYGLCRRVAADLGLPPPDGVSVGGCSDGNVTAGVGTATLDGLGPVGGGAHAVDEFVVVSEMPRRADLLGRLTEEVRQRGGVAA